jgi:hypothetical protein
MKRIMEKYEIVWTHRRVQSRYGNHAGDKNYKHEEINPETICAIVEVSPSGKGIHDFGTIVNKQNGFTMTEIVIELNKNWWIELSSYCGNWGKKDEFDRFNSKYKKAKTYLEKKLEGIHENLPFLKKYMNGKSPRQWENGYYTHINKIYKEFKKLSDPKKASLLENSSEQNEFIEKHVPNSYLWKM